MTKPLRKNGRQNDGENSQHNNIIGVRTKRKSQKKTVAGCRRGFENNRKKRMERDDTKKIKLRKVMEETKVHKGT